MRRRVRSVAALAAALPCAQCTGWQSAFNAAGVQAAELRTLMIVIMAVCGAVWLAVVAVLVLALRRRRPARAEPLVVNRQTQQRMSVVVAGSVIGTVAVITAFTVASYFATRRLAAAADNAVAIRVRGSQWWWEVTYLDPKPERVFTTANEIHIPVGRPIHVQLVASDVIHSFWVPSLAGKQDLIPGRDNAITFTARRAGVYRGQCAEFCGLQHARMAMIVVAEPPSAFEAWRRAQLAPAATPADAEQRTGEQVFLAKPCSACHTIRGTTATGSNGPDLTHVASRRTIAAGALETTRGSLAAWVADPQTIKPGNNMPMVPLSADELTAISAYLAGLK